ncbi:antitoxin VbhA family protein [Actinomyces wuliandei]|uniref:antitoxin VbhA family protein n=1 Tax=Actinomyces wuliandei TaxID=2057743 RepID=UPI00111934C6|nr:antitoxin VbhA family protein [Actinomyces wuliandei]
MQGTPAPHSTTSAEEAAQDRLAFARAALGAAGHEVTDPYLVDVLQRHAHGEITGDQARDLSRRHVLGH